MLGGRRSRAQAEGAPESPGDRKDVEDRKASVECRSVEDQTELVCFVAWKLIAIKYEVL